MIYSKQLIWSTALNSEWFPKQVEIPPICTNGNAAYPRIWLSLCCIHPILKLQTDLKPRNIFCANLLRGMLFQSVKFIFCAKDIISYASLYFVQIYWGARISNLSSPELFSWQNCFFCSGKTGHHRKYFLNILEKPADWIFI